MSKYQTTTHVTFNIGYHVVFCPKYRHNLHRYRAADELRRLLTVKDLDLGITIQTMEEMPNHVHLFLNGLPSMSMDYIEKQLKVIPRTTCEGSLHTFGNILHCGHVPTL